MERWVYLDAIRGLAALMVAVFHYQGLFSHNQFFDFGYLAVDVFFVLSGMVLQAVYGEALLDGSTGLSQFAIARFRRLYPMVAISIGAVFALNLLSVPDSNVSVNSGTALLRAAFLLPTTGTGNAFPANGPLWSLMLEVVVNVVWAVALKLSGKRAIFMGGLFALVGAVVAVCGHGGSLNFGWQGNAIQLGCGVIRALAGFLLGAALSAGRHRLIPVVQAARGRLLLVGALLVMTRPFLQDLQPLLSDAVPLAGAILLLVTLRECNAPSRASGLLTLLGAASYPVYLLHAPLGRLAQAEMPTGTAGWLFLCALMPTGLIVHFFLERPLQRFLKRIG